MGVNVDFKEIFNEDFEELLKKPIDYDDLVEYIKKSDFMYSSMTVKKFYIFEKYFTMEQMEKLMGPDNETGSYYLMRHMPELPNEDIVNMLKYVNINHKNSSGASLIFFANIDNIKILLENGADIHDTNNRYENLLINAYFNAMNYIDEDEDNEDLVKLMFFLIDNGVDYNVEFINPNGGLMNFIIYVENKIIFLKSELENDEEYDDDEGEEFIPEIEHKLNICTKLLNKIKSI